MGRLEKTFGPRQRTAWSCCGRPEEGEVGELAGEDGDWAAMTSVQRLSAAPGGAPAAADVNLDGVGTGVRAPCDGHGREGDLVNPPGVVWRSLVDWNEFNVMKDKWQTIRGASVETKNEDVVRRCELDPWQAFGHDIALAKAEEQQRFLSQPQGRRAGWYKPLRMLLSGAAGAPVGSSASSSGVKRVENANGSIEAPSSPLSRRSMK